MAFPPKKTAGKSPAIKPAPESSPASSSLGGNPPEEGPPPDTTVPDDKAVVSPYPQIDDFLSTLDPDELSYLKSKCEALYPEDNTQMGQAKTPMLDEKMFTQ